jgi:HSP20 family molecular chaperone IbpA
MAEQTVPTPGGETALTREPTRSGQNFASPPVDIFEDERGLMVVADLPGVDSDGADIRVDNGVLTIEARAQHVVRSRPMQREYELIGFYRQFQLPDEIDTGRISAELRNGVLTVTLPRMERAAPRRIEVHPS